MTRRCATMIACLGLLACGDASEGPPESPGLVSRATAERGHGGSASLAEYYTTLWDLKQHSDLGVLGRVEAIGATENMPGDPGRVTVSVTQVLWQAAGVQPPKSVSFLVLRGGEDGDSEGVLPKVGDPLIVFLREYATGMYRESGAGSGRFRIDTGIVKPVVSNAVQLDPETDVATFESLLATAEQQPCAALDCPATSKWDASMCRCVVPNAP